MKKIEVRMETVQKCGTSAGIVEGIIIIKATREGTDGWTPPVSFRELSDLTGMAHKSMMKATEALLVAGLLERKETKGLPHSMPRFQYRVK